MTAGAAELAARCAAAAAYDRGRAAGYLDLGAGRRANALARLERQAREAARAEGYTRGALAEITRAELRAAFAREARARLARADRANGYSGVQTAGVRNALRRAAAEFGFTIEALGLAPELERIPIRGRRRRDGWTVEA